MTRSRRKAKLLKTARARGFDAVLITHLPDIRYLTGFTGSAGAVVLAGGRIILFTDGRYTEQAKSEAEGAKVVIAQKPALLAASEWIETAGVGRCAFDPAHTTVSALASMRATVSSKVRRNLFQPCENLVGAQREVKDATEIALMREAADLGCSIFDATLQDLVPASSEVEIALALERRARSAGADGMSFESRLLQEAREALCRMRARRTQSSPEEVS